MSTRENRKRNRIDILLDRRLHDHGRRLMQAGIDNFEPGVTKSACDDLRATVVSVQTDLADE